MGFAERTQSPCKVRLEVKIMSETHIPNLRDLFDENLKEAKNDNPRAWVDLGYAYLYGMGVEADMEKALECFRKGAEAGDMRACYAIYDTWGNGVSLIAEEEAMEMCRLAASLGHEKAAFVLKQQYKEKTNGKRKH